MALELDKMTRLPGDEAFRRDSIKGTQWEATYAGALSFMRRKYTRDLAGVDIAVTGIPFDQAVSHRAGTRFGPEGIRKASAGSAAAHGHGNTRRRLYQHLPWLFASQIVDCTLGREDAAIGKTDCRRKSRVARCRQ